jgi:hypothetical protein
MPPVLSMIYKYAPNMPDVKVWHVYLLKNIANQSIRIALARYVVNIKHLKPISTR